MNTFDSTQIDARVEELIKRHHVPGLAIAVVQDDQISSKGYGLATVDPPVPCSADTLFDIASSSKSLTAASVALLVDDNEKYADITWNSIVSRLLPDDFVMSEKTYTDSVTLDDILSHRTGPPGHDSS